MRALTYTLDGDESALYWFSNIGYSAYPFFPLMSLLSWYPMLSQTLGKRRCNIGYFEKIPYIVGQHRVCSKVCHSIEGWQYRVFIICTLCCLLSPTLHCLLKDTMFCPLPVTLCCPLVTTLYCSKITFCCPFISTLYCLRQATLYWPFQITLYCPLQNTLCCHNKNPT